MLFLGLEFDNRADIVLIEIPCTFLTISRDKWYRCSFASEFEYDFYLEFLVFQCARDDIDVVRGGEESGGGG